VTIAGKDLLSGYPLPALIPRDLLFLTTESWKYASISFPFIVSK